VVKSYAALNVQISPRFVTQREFERHPNARGAPPEALQRRYLRQPGAFRLKLNAFQPVVSNLTWHIACTTGAPQQPTINPQSRRSNGMRKVLIAAALAFSACGGGSNTDDNSGGNHTYPQACGQFCQAVTPRFLDCSLGQRHWTQQDLQRRTNSCNAALQDHQITAQQCEAANEEFARYTCAQLCDALGGC